MHLQLTLHVLVKIKQSKQKKMQFFQLIMYSDINIFPKAKHELNQAERERQRRLHKRKPQLPVLQ